MSAYRWPVPVHPLANVPLRLGDLEVSIRDASPEDEGFVFKAWLVGHRDRGDWPKRLSSRRYFAEHKVTVAKLLARARCLVACNASRPSQSLGFVVFERKAGERVLHWLYTKETYRRNGVARALLAHSIPSPNGLGGPVRCSHWTVAAQEMRDRGRPWFYDPFFVEAL